MHPHQHQSHASNTLPCTIDLGLMVSLCLKLWRWQRLSGDCRNIDDCANLPDRICQISESCSQMIQIKNRCSGADINFNLEDYGGDVKQMSNLTKKEFVHVLCINVVDWKLEWGKKCKLGESRIVLRESGASQKSQFSFPRHDLSHTHAASIAKCSATKQALPNTTDAEVGKPEVGQRSSSQQCFSILGMLTV
ncbi:hypothetical protein L2E82_43515 [Cichorium intybus]|uniref:Uncharacterized protein n=1 Tax=Cichorium intybus TaxID=13427 RepID=A0ACB8ZNJ5_CICIN|nr:hypothetical protein L2E82_43515 [Cichorium intybus]